MGRAGWVKASVEKTYRYLKRNGPAAAWTAVLERLLEREEAEGYVPPTEMELKAQREEVSAWKERPFFSVVVPAYRTPPAFIEALCDSMQAQSYPGWELVAADAGDDGEWQRFLQEREDERFRYVKLAENKGIAENTNAAIDLACGEYIGLLDHDDFLAPNALYEMALALRRSRQAQVEPVFLYSDEDKCDGEGKFFYEPHRKMDFNLDLLLSNNYVCHFLLMRGELLKKLKLRAGFDGAQDYDLILRAAAGALEGVPEEAFVHVSRILYHWRCHSLSTASNPASKAYAYEAGRRALEDFCSRRGWQVQVKDTRHLGFYCCEFGSGRTLLQMRRDVGALAGPLPSAGGRLCSGIYDRDGEKAGPEDDAGTDGIGTDGTRMDGIGTDSTGTGGVRMRYAGLRKGFGGYLHRAELTQDVEAADVRTMQVQPEWQEELEAALSRIRSGADPVRESLVFSRKIRKAGLRILWDPGRKEGRH